MRPKRRKPWPSSMSTRFGYYDDWKTPTLTCPRCGWQGTFNEGDIDQHDQ